MGDRINPVPHAVSPAGVRERRGQGSKAPWRDASGRSVQLTAQLPVRGGKPKLDASVTLAGDAGLREDFASGL